MAEAAASLSLGGPSRILDALHAAATVSARITVVSGQQEKYQLRQQLTWLASQLLTTGCLIHHTPATGRKEKHNMIKKLVRLLPIAAAAVLAVPALAGTVTLSNITGTWFDANPSDPGGTLVYGGGGTGAPTVRWGTPSSTGGSKSGYNFTAVGGAIVNNLPPNTPIFSMGTFEHLNFPISSGTSITGIKLKITTDVDIDGTTLMWKTPTC